MPPSIAPVFLQMDLGGALSVGLVTVVFAFLFVDLFDAQDTREGVNAFLEKRDPKWRNC